MKENKLKYTGLTYDEIYSQVNDLIRADSRFDNFRESAIAQTLIEIFAGSTDILNYYIQRRAEECFFDTAQLKSSVISKSRELAYDITRLTPATSYITLTVKGDIAGKMINNGTHPHFINDPLDPNYKSPIGAPVQIQIPYYSKFSGEGSSYVLQQTLTINLSYDIWNKMTTLGKDYEEDFTTDSWGNPIAITEGVVKEKIISGQSNTQTGAPFQIYKIEDKSFSDIYGDKDYFFNNVTQVYVGENKTSKTEYKIERQSLLNWKTMVVSDLDDVQQVCLIRTANDETVELLFGDDKYAAKGPSTHKDNIYIQYLSTKGDAGNKVGVIGNSMNYSGKVYTNNGVDITSFCKFKFRTNVIGGSAFESMDSIKYYSPKIYYSLDRLVSKDDYLAYLSSLTTPILVKNAIAWGEQEERDKYNKFAISKMFNSVLFCVVGSLYQKDETRWLPKNNEGLEDALLDNIYDPYAFNTQGYFNVFITKDQVSQLRRYIVETTYNAIKGDPLPDGSWSTIKGIYGDNDAYLEIEYGSDYPENASNIVGFKYNTSAYDNSLKVKLSEITLDASDDDATGMEAIAVKINDAFVDAKDFRSNASDNANYGESAFVGRFFDSNTSNPPKIVRWNNDKRRFELSFNEKDQPAWSADKSECYPLKIIKGGFADIIGLGDEQVLGVSEGELGTISSKIVKLIDELETRSQISTKHIYISPIIHRFKLAGNISMRSLFDLEQTKLDINNNLYEFLDINNDFNKPLYISNIIEIIEQHPAVVHADVKLVPEDITNGVGSYINEYYDSRVVNGFVYNDVLKKYNIDSTNPIFDSVKTVLDDYLSKSTYIPNNWGRYFSKKYDVSTVSWRWGRDVIDNDYTTLESYSYNINNYINERTFYLDVASPLYEEFLTMAKNQSDCSYDSYTCSFKDSNGDIITIPNYKKFIGYHPTNNEYNSDNIFDDVVGTDFSDVLTEIHKDLSYIIMANMLDSNGNVLSEYDVNGRYIRGGYSLESELIQVNAESVNYTYGQ